MARKANTVKSFENIGEEYEALRAMRWAFLLSRLWALDVYSRYAQTAVLPRKRAFGRTPLVMLHHIFVRSRLPPPHTLHGWQESEYVRWVDEHAPEEILLPIGWCVEHSGEMGSTWAR
ncbi:hypothetical protein EV363DRAFT_1321706 [Boletus edulis]|uniref:Uncharacterized protein n=1 Tax=Boletus edulis BED1 TaxID=1328754 RepID=A0AAD4G5A5_BOLED|nr:hypothetical protein EV363DRAFT_1321706 [Boletus edulis]KAF8415604.1 hypothetical protein L210DRAFT_3585564 [Boletus edulis BED1]KAF8441590.1 hypothetical protein L210DRAFT_3537649 [Boletus edulis BED1]